MKIRSKTFKVPVDDPALIHLAQKLLQKQQISLKQKLQAQQQKQQRIKQIQVDFEQWAQQKEKNMQIKSQQTEKKKAQHLQKIKKKCQDHDKLINKKRQEYSVNKKKSLKNAWKKAEVFNNDIIIYQQSKAEKQKKLRSVSNPFINMSKQQQLKNVQDRQQLLQSKVYINLKNNSYLYSNQLITSTLPEKNKLEIMKAQSQRIKTNPHQYSNSFQVQEHLRRTRIQQQRMQLERIQQLGQKLDKIQLSRKKKQELIKKKAQSLNNSRSFQQKPFDSKQMNKNDDTNKFNGNSFSSKMKRYKDWSQDVKQKHQQLRREQLKNGTQYLEHVRVRHLKNVLHKNIAETAIQKKLYLDRLKKSQIL